MTAARTRRPGGRRKRPRPLTHVSQLGLSPLGLEGLQDRIDGMWADYQRTYARPEEWALRELGAEVLSRACRGGRFASFTAQQVAYLRDFCDLRVSLLAARCCRGGSKTWLDALGIAHLMWHLGGAGYRITLLGGALSQAQDCYRYLADFLAAPAFAGRLDGDPTITQTRFRGGGVVRCLAASERQTRGPRANMLVIEEACSADDRIIRSALHQVAGAARPKVVMTSTPHRLMHVFHDICTRPELGWRVHHWTAHDCPWIAGRVVTTDDGTEVPYLDWAAEAYGESEYRIEVLGEFAAQEGAVFRLADIQRAAAPLPEARIDREAITGAITMGVDWGFRHPTVALVLADVTEGGGAAPDPEPGHPLPLLELRASRSWRERALETAVAPELVELATTYHVTEVLLDASHQSPAAVVRRLLAGAPLAPRARTVAFGKHKSDMVRALQAQLEGGRLRLHRAPQVLLDQLTAYHWDASGERPAKGDDDWVDALMLACWGHHRMRARAGRGPARVAPLDALFGPRRPRELYRPW